MNFSKQALVDAVSALVDVEDSKALRCAEVIDSMARFRSRHPDAWLGYELEVFNPLVSLAQNDPATFERIQDLIDSKRLARGAKPAWPDAEEKRFDKPEYQRQLMQERRRRSGRAVEIENLRRPERDRLQGPARLEFENRMIAKWGNDLRSIVEAARVEAGGRLPRERQTKIREQYWTTVDAQLDQEYENARSRRLGVNKH